MTAHLAERLTRLQDYFTEDPQPELSGRLTRMVGLTLECVGCPMVVGDRCVITGAPAPWKRKWWVLRMTVSI